MRLDHALRPSTLRLLLTVALFARVTGAQQPRPERARDMGIALDGTAGALDAITDVPGVTVGVRTLIRGSGALQVGHGPVRTGVTAIFPRGAASLAPVFAGWFSLNGNGEMTGTTWLEEYGLLFYPITITNTNSVGVVRDAVIEWGRDRLQDSFHCCLPVTAETWDGDLNDIFGSHVHREDVFAALDSARGGAVPEGNVGGGTGMICLGWKGGTGTASRRVGGSEHGYTVGVLVQCNFGLRSQLRVAGVPVGHELAAAPACFATTAPLDSARAAERCPPETSKTVNDEHGSIIVVVATDAPLLPHQLKRIAKRASLGIGRMGGIAGSGSGDIFLAFSTAPIPAGDARHEIGVRAVDDDYINPLYEATVQATEEAIINALLAARTMTGVDDYRVPALPHDALRALLAKYGRLAPRTGK